jgi:hypothetical protein
LGWLILHLFPGGAKVNPWMLFAVALVWVASLLMTAVSLEGITGGLWFFAGFAILLLIGAGMPLHTVPFVGTITAMILFVSGFHRVRSEMENSLYVRFFSFAPRATRSFLTGLCFFAAFLTVFGILKAGFVIPKEGFDVLLKSSEPIVNIMIPGISLEEPVRDAVEDIVRARSEPDTPDFAIDQTVDQVMSNASESLGFNVTGNEPVGDVLYQFFSLRTQGLSANGRTGLLAAIGVLIFLIAKGLALIFEVIALGFSFIVYELLLASRVFRVETTSVKKEIVVL